MSPDIAKCFWEERGVQSCTQQRAIDLTQETAPPLCSHGFHCISCASLLPSPQSLSTWGCFCLLQAGPLCVPRHELLPQLISHSSQCLSQLFQEMKSKHYGQCHKQNLIVTRTCCAGRSQGKWLLLEKPSCPLPADKSVHTESPAHEQCDVGVSDTQDLTSVRAASMEILVPVTWEMLNKSWFNQDELNS